MDERQGTPMQQGDQDEWNSAARQGGTRDSEAGTGLSSEADGFFRRIWKYRLHYAIMLPALLLIAYFKGYPLLRTLYASFLDVTVFKPLSDSPWVGFANYRHLFDQPVFRQILVNTLTIKLMYTAFCGFAALVLALAVSAVAGARTRGALTTLFLMPYFIPAIVFANMAMLAVSPGFSPFGIHSAAWLRTDHFRLAYVATDIVKTVGLPILIAVAAIGARHAAFAGGRAPFPGSYMRLNLVPAAKAVAAFMLMQLAALLAGNFDLANQLVNPLVFATGDTIESFLFRMTFMNMELNTGGPIAAIQFIVQFGCTLIAFFLLRRLFARDLFTPHSGTAAISAIQTSGRGRRSAGTIVSLSYALIVLALLYLLFVYPFATSEEGPGLSTLADGYRYARYIFLYAAAAVVFMLITLTLSFPLTVKDLPGRRLYKGGLLALLSAGSVSFYEFGLVKDMGMVNTVYPLYIAGFFAVLPIFVLKSIYNGKHGALRRSYEGRGEGYMFFSVYIPKVWKPLLALGAMQFVALWNGTYAPMIYMARPDLFPPVLRFMVAQSQMQDGGSGLAYGPATMLQFGALIALPPLLVLLLLRRWLTAEVMTGQTRGL